MSIKDTIKSLEEADEKLKKAEELERKGEEAHKKAAALRDESQRNLEKIEIEKQNIFQINSAKDVEFDQRESELKNREVTLAAGHADLERKTTIQAAEQTAREDEITRSDAELQRKVTENREHKERLDAIYEKYKSVEDFINKTL